METEHPVRCAGADNVPFSNHNSGNNFFYSLNCTCSCFIVFPVTDSQFHYNQQKFNDKTYWNQIIEKMT